MRSREQLTALSIPFPKSLIKQPAPGKHGTYVKHSTVTERLLHELGGFSFEVVEIVRGYAPEIVTNNNTYAAREGAVVGVLGRMTVQVDGETRVVTEVGSEDNPAMGHDGENLKNAASDALKRCAMRLGVGLHLWSQELYYLDTQMRKLADAEKAKEPTTSLSQVMAEAASGAEIPVAPIGPNGGDIVVLEDSSVPAKAKRHTKGEYEAAAQAHVLALVNGDPGEAALAWPLILEAARVEKVGTKKEHDAVLRAANDQLGVTDG